MDDELQYPSQVSHDPLSTDLGSFSVINDLRERLLMISPAQIAQSERRLSPLPRRSRVIGVVDKESTRALHALWMALRSEAALEQAKAEGAIEPEIEQDHKERHSIVDNLADVACELWWTQAKMDLNFHECESVGIHTGWTLVVSKNPGPGGLAELMRIPFQIGGGPGSDNE